MRILCLAAACIALTSGLPAAAQSYPDRPIRLVVPFPPGGTVDVSARAIAPELSQALGQTILVDNRGGAGGAIGADYVAKAPPDGYTLLMGSNSSLTVAAALRTSLPFDPIASFAPISLLGSTPFALVVHPSVKAQTVAELIALAKSRPGDLTMASGGVGHLVGELFQSMTGTKFLHVPFQGVGPAGVALMGGQVDLMFEQLASSAAPALAGKTRALAVTSEARVAQLPDVPTAIEAGVPGYVVESITGILAPAGTPAAVIERLNRAIEQALQSPEVQKRFAGISVQTRHSTPEAFAAYLREDLKRWQEVVETAGIPRQ